MANNLDIFQHQLDRFGVVTTMDAYLLDIETNEVLLKLDTLKVANINKEGQSKSIIGGMQSDLLIDYDYGMTVGVEITDALISLESLSLLWGNQVKTEGVTLFEEMKMTVGEGGAIDLSASKVLEEGLKVYKDGVLVEHQATLAPSSGTVTGITLEGITGEVVVFANVVKENAKSLTLTADSFPATVKLVGKTRFINESTGKSEIGQFSFNKFKLGSTFTFTLDGEGEASTFNFSGKLLLDTATREYLTITKVK